MRFGWLACLAWLVVPAVSQAQCCWYVPVCVTYEVRPVVSYRPEWREEKVPIVIQKVNYRKEVTPVKTSIWTLKEFDEQVQRTYYTPVPRVVERDVPTWCWAPVVWCDPCTGCPFVSYYPQQTVQRVQCVEYDYRKEDRVEATRVCRWVPQSVVVDQVRWIPEVTRENSWTVQRTCVLVPYQSQVCVPVWMPYVR